MTNDFTNDSILAPLARACGQDGILLNGVVLQSQIGEGGMGRVYLGFHTRLNVTVAVKILKRPTAEALEELNREARLSAKIDHPNLIRVLDVNCDAPSGLHYIVMEWVDGTSAVDLLFDSMDHKGHPLNVLTGLQIALGAARALAASHAEGIVHCDVKPDNILVRRRDGMVKLSDFGLAGKIRDQQPGGIGSIISGTLGFIAPEIFKGSPHSPASDVYALGASLYELLTGRLPHASSTNDQPSDRLTCYQQRQFEYEPVDPRAWEPALDAEIAKLILKCLARDPSKRFQDGAEAAEALEEAIERLFEKQYAPTMFLDGRVPAKVRRQVSSGHVCVPSFPDAVEVNAEEPVAVWC